MLKINAFESIVEQYATEAAFLWLLRKQSEKSTLYDQQDLSELEQRITGNLEGLIESGEMGWHICLRQLEFEEAGETFVAAMLALHLNDAQKIKTVCEIALENPQMLPGLESALGWINETSSKFWIDRFLNVTDLRYQDLGLSACSIKRRDPVNILTRILQSHETTKNPQLYAKALKLVGELKRFDLVPALNQGMDSEDEEVKFWASWSAILMGNLAVINNIKPFVFKQNAFLEQALELAFNILPNDQARIWISEMSKESANLRSAIKASSILGDPQVVPWLIQQMKNVESSRLAGLSFSLLTGIDLEQNKLDKDPDIVFKDNSDTDIEDDAENEDSDLPWPDPIKIQYFWKQQEAKFKKGNRYFAGQPITIEWLKSVLVNGNQFQRSCVALKLAMLESNSILLNTATPTVSI